MNARWIIAGAAVAVAAGAFALGPGRADDSQNRSAAVEPVELSAQGSPRDLGDVTNEEMEAVIAANPDVVPMRLALVERYLRAGELEHAKAHSAEALARSTDPLDEARALRYLGWTTALLGEPAEAEHLIEQSLALEPGNLDALWFLANVRFEGLDRAADAEPLLEEILASDVPDERQRTLVAEKLAEVQAAR